MIDVRRTLEIPQFNVGQTTTIRRGVTLSDEGTCK